MAEGNGEIKEKRPHEIDSEIFHLRLKTLEDKIEIGTDRMINKMGELVDQMKLMRETLLTAAMGVGQRHDGALMQIVLPIIKTLLLVVGAIIIWFTGLKELLPKFVH